MNYEQKLKDAGVSVDIKMIQSIENLHKRYAFYGHAVSKEQIAQVIIDNFNPKDPENSRKIAFNKLNRAKLSPIKKTAKINRNAQCPCGSGKKYKKCCNFRA